MKNALPSEPLYQIGDLIRFQDGTLYRVKHVRSFGLSYYLMPADDFTIRQEMSLGWDATPEYILTNRI